MKLNPVPLTTTCHQTVGLVSMALPLGAPHLKLPELVEERLDEVGVNPHEGQSQHVEPLPAMWRSGSVGQK